MFIDDGKLDLARFSQPLRDSLTDFAAVLLACVDTSCNQVNPSHFLLALAKVDNSLTQKVFQSREIQPETVVELIQDELAAGGGEVPWDIALTRDSFSGPSREMLEELDRIGREHHLQVFTEKPLLYLILKYLEPEIRDIFDGVIDLDQVRSELEPSDNEPPITIFNPESGEVDQEAFDGSGQFFLKLLQSTTEETGFSKIRNEHVGIALMALEDGVTQKGLRIQLQNPDRIIKELKSKITTNAPLKRKAITLHRDTFYRSVIRILEKAAAITREDKKTAIGESQLLRSLLTEDRDGVLGHILSQLRLNFPQLICYAAANLDVRIVIKPKTDNPWEDLGERWPEMEPYLQKRIISQDRAIKVLLTKLSVAIGGVKEPDKPVSVLFFAGPTGVGKTEISRVLTEFIFGSNDALLRFDMSEYMEKHSVSKLIGPPPGYVGHEDGGQLTNKVLAKPFSIVLFDEVEKAHPDIYKIFLQIFDSARLTDGKGREVRLDHTLIICTSNVGSVAAEAVGTEKERLAAYTQAFKREFPPEIQGRFSDVVFFNPLSKAACGQILRIKIAKLQERYQDIKNIEMGFSKRVLTYLLDKGFSPTLGARPLNQIIADKVNAPIALALLTKIIQDGDRIYLDLANGEVQVKPVK